MQLVIFSQKTDNTSKNKRLGAVEGDLIADLSQVPGAPESMAACCALDSEGLDRLTNLVAQAPRLALAEATLHAPFPRPARNIFCVGKNYHEHAREFAQSGFDASAKEIVPEAPVIFTKPPSAVIGPGDTIPGYLDPTSSVDYEGELTVVIGKGGRGISREDALDHVFGYTIINDVTSRHLQHKHRQWVIGKGIDGFCPMGPAVMTADEAPDPRKLHLRTWVNGDLRQDVSVADLIFDIPTLISTISAYITLEPGDLIATGTPVGVGLGFNPPKFLRKGDVVRIEIGGIGVLENQVA
ncbi:2-keto-4-pentenoate hydratase/2-oxohepta-3-ene-1,7-dioic acid hydratase in catechol pathway [Bosea sp. BK604]|nr:2-keto-4-pentenoate hydratase/2-oxohepta-3-ene-1,7-dioic acid hydratase in catechol pathway [Bosea sp. BK604]